MSHERDRGAVDVSIQMLFGLVMLVFVLLLVFETVAYWHTRNVFDEAAAEGVRVAAAHDGTCAEGVTAARAMVEQMASGWSSRVTIQCTDGPVVTMSVGGHPPGVLGRTLQTWVTAVETAPKEG